MEYRCPPGSPGRLRPECWRAASRAKSFWVELQPDAVLERTDHAACDPEREPRFAAVSGAGRGYEVPLAPKHELIQAGDILIASDEFCAVGQKLVVAIPR